MLSAPIPADEAERLEELRRLRILDTAAEERFDRITRIARSLFSVPIALVSLVDANRQWFKSEQGLGAREAPRAVSFCGHAVAANDTLVVEDALLDARFADNPVVTGEPGVRFYAGVPLRSHSGHALGTLCLIDRAPRAFGAEERARLRDLAIWAESELREGGDQAALVARIEPRLFLAVAADTLAEPLIALLPSGGIAGLNGAAAAWLGRDAGELVGQRLEALLEAPDAGPLLEGFAKLSGQPAGTALPVMLRGARAVLSTAVAGERPVWTVRVESGQSARSLESFGSEVLEASGVVLFDWDYASGRMRFAGPWTALTGCAAAPHDLASFERMVLPEDMPGWSAGLYEMLKRGAVRGEFRIAGEPPVAMLFRGRVSARDGSGQVLRVAGAFIRKNP